MTDTDRERMTEPEYQEWRISVLEAQVAAIARVLDRSDLRRVLDEIVH